MRPLAERESPLSDRGEPRALHNLPQRPGALGSRSANGRKRKSYTRITQPMKIRMQQLRDAGLSTGAIGAVVALDFGCSPPSPSTVRVHTTGPRFPKHGISHGDIENWEGRTGK